MALIGKAGRYRDLGQRQVANNHQLLGGLDALAQQPLMRRQPGGDTEGAGKMADREPEFAGNLREGQFPAEIRLKPLAGALRLPGRKAAVAWLGAAREPAISLRDMRREREQGV